LRHARFWVRLFLRQLDRLTGGIPPVTLIKVSYEAHIWDAIRSKLHRYVVRRNLGTK